MTGRARTVRAELHADHLVLLAVLDDLRASGRRVPCQDLTDAWRLYISDDVEDQRRAGQLCTGCSALADCAAFITRHPREAGCFAGQTEADRRPQKGRPATSTERKTA